MNTPPLLLGAALLFWGWQSGFLIVGAALAVVLESARLVPHRWELSDKDFTRLWDLCTFAFVATAIYAFTANEGLAAVGGFFRNASPATQSKAVDQTAKAALLMFRWAPMIFFPFAAVQAFSTREKIPWTVFSVWLRRKAARQKGASELTARSSNVAYPYFAVCLAAASVATTPNLGFYVGLALLLAWALWFQRSKRFAVPLWGAVLALALVFGFFGSRAFFEFIRLADSYSASWLAQFMVRDTDPKESRTFLGKIGRIKLSGKIVLRVKTKEYQTPPPLLREASYRFFKTPLWAGAGAEKDFTPVTPETNQTTWLLAPRSNDERVVTIAGYLTEHGQDARRGVLPLPHGIVKLENLPAFLLSTNRLGVVRVDEGPGLVIYDAYYTARSTIDARPEREDMMIPDKEDAALSQIVSQLHLREQSTNQMLQTLSAFFTENFQYSLWQSAAHLSQTNLTPLGNFLLHDRSGHCEYFATAAALLLRKAGVPARYAVGYAVHEKSGKQYVVRLRHAHAWCLAYVNGAWQDFDVTPGSWFEAEAQPASLFEFLSDAWDRVWFEFSKWRWGQTKLRQFLLWGMAPVLLILLARLFFQKQWKRLRQENQRTVLAMARPGLDSEFYLLEQQLAAQGSGRQSSETLSDWLGRVATKPRLAVLSGPLDTVLRLHNRYRFDPKGISPSEREALRTNAQTCLATLRAQH